MPGRRQVLQASAAAAAAIGLVSCQGEDGGVAATPDGLFGSAQAQASTRPNILFIMVDEQRDQMVYESAALASFRDTALPTQRDLINGGTRFVRHYAGSIACVPGRATLYTGHYPSLHGVTQTDGAAKDAFDADMFWLESTMVPTMGHYFRAGGYQTYWRGKWHVSEEDVLVPGTRTRINTYDENGNRLPAVERLYTTANNLEPFGFDGWIGPEPHGSAALNTGGSAAIGQRGRDVGIAEQTIEVLDTLESQSANAAPWFLMASFVNPHDIALWGFFSRVAINQGGVYDFTVEDNVPTDLFDARFLASRTESLVGTKPSVQEAYRQAYSSTFQPSLFTPQYYRFYYQLHQEVDREIAKVMARLTQSRFAANTIVVFTSDHGDFLGSHGGLFQKWYTMYEEALRVPLVVNFPGTIAAGRTLDLPTSHVDVLPTLLGLAGLDGETLREKIAADFSDALPLVGRNLAPLLRGEVSATSVETPVFYMTDDDPSRGDNQNNFIGIGQGSVPEPGSVECIAVRLNGIVWKYARYFESAQDWTSAGTPGDANVSNVIDLNQTPVGNTEGTTNVVYQRTITLCPAPEEYEMYNLTADPLELTNLAGTSHPMEATLRAILVDQCRQKRLTPISGTVAGQVACGSAATCG